MDGEKKITVNIINRNYPPNQGITGESAAELAEFLIDRGVHVKIFTVASEYFGGPESKKIVGDVKRIPTFYKGKKLFFRLLANLYEGFALVVASLRSNASLTICMTDPPLLNFWASVFFRKKHPWFLWSMDLYPDAFVAGNLIRRNGIFDRLINLVLVKRKPDHIIALGKYQIQYLQEKYKDLLPFTLLPCGIFPSENGVGYSRPSWHSDPSKIYLGYCGNLGEAHSIEFLKNVVTQLDPLKFHLVVAVYGSKARELVNYASGKPGVSILRTVRRGELSYIDIHLATLNSEWVNICVPSKTVSSVCAGSAFLYCGQHDSDNWALLHEAGWIIHEKEMESQLQDFLQSIDLGLLAEKKSKAAKLGEQLNLLKKEAFENILNSMVSTIQRTH